MKIVYDIEAKQINYLDERFYTLDDTTFYPSVTTILDAYPKGYGLFQWLKEQGMNADQVMKQAGEVGSHVHDAIDKYLNGEKLTWVDENLKPLYSLDEWLMILKFKEFWDTYTPTIIVNEQSLVSTKMRLGGTLDLVCTINGQTWLIDYKTSNSIYKTHELQLSAYAILWNEMSPKQKIERWGIMHLKALSRGPDKANKILQGKGWQIKEFERPYEEAYKIFDMTHAIWDEENPNYKPKNMVYPDTIQIVKAKVG